MAGEFSGNGTVNMNVTMAYSLYIHIPFCSQKCRYCDFYSIQPGSGMLDRFIDALLREWQMRKGALQEADLKTIFVGGGTPSLLSVPQWERLIDGLLRGVQLGALREWSIECNPESFSSEHARLWRDRGVTRLTFGVQSLVDRELSVLGRCHTADQALTVLSNPVLERFVSIGVDLMYGLPGQTLSSWEKTVTRVLDSGPIRHLSAYELTLFPETPLGRHEGILPLPDEEEIPEMFASVGQWCTTRGLERYEVSNYALPGHECLHNIAYWSHAPYWGLGPAAHSYEPPRRIWNVSDAISYCEALERRELPVESEEELGVVALSEEMIFLGLRTRWGLDTESFRSATGEEFEQGRLDTLSRFQDEGLLIKSGTRWLPTEKGMIMADAMARELI